MKKGDILIAKDRCRIHGTKRDTLTIGKSYEIIDLYDNRFYIIDDEEQEHNYDLSGEYNYLQWFHPLKIAEEIY